MKDILSALSIPRVGRVYDLGQEISRDMPRMDAGVILPFSMSTYRSPEDMAKSGDMEGITFHVEAISGSFHCSTHMDALVHCQYQGHIHGGADMATVRRDFGWTEGGAETVKPMVGRGILLDVAAHLELDILPDHYAITPQELESTADAQGTALIDGDYVLVRTGKAKQFREDPTSFVKGCPGISRAAAGWLADKGMVTLCIDSTSADPQPEDWTSSAHVLLLVERGIYIVENVNMEELSRDRVYEFFFVCSPLKFKGATGSWVRPIAIA